MVQNKKVELDIDKLIQKYGKVLNFKNKGKANYSHTLLK